GGKGGRARGGGGAGREGGRLPPLCRAPRGGRAIHARCEERARRHRRNGHCKRPFARRRSRRLRARHVARLDRTVSHLRHCERREAIKRFARGLDRFFASLLAMTRNDSEMKTPRGTPWT